MYAYLTVSTEARELVRFPDGQEALVAASEGASVADAWRDEAVAALDSRSGGQAAAAAADRATERGKQEEARREAHEAAVAAWRAELDRRSEWVGTIGELRRIREAYEAECPRPELPELPEPTTAVPRPTVEAVTWWCAHCVVADVAATLAPATGVFPRTELAAVLTHLQGAGWKVVHVSEERVVEHSADSSRAIVVGASILLRSDA